MQRTLVVVVAPARPTAAAAPSHPPATRGGKRRHHRGPGAPKGVTDLPLMWGQGRTGRRNILKVGPFLTLLLQPFPP